MLFALVAFAVALVGTVQATPLAADTTTVTPTVDLVSVDATVPVLDLHKDSVTSHPNVTLGSVGDAVGAIYPATLFLCRTSGCGSCTGYSLDGMAHNVCLEGGFYFVSMFISQPSNQGLPFAIYTGPLGCGAFAQVPVVNTCYNAVGYTGFDWVLTP